MKLLRGGAVPVLLVGRASHGVAGVGFDDGPVAGADEGNASDHVEGLAEDVCVPVGSGPWGEAHLVETGA